MAALPVLLCHLPLIPHCRRVPPLALRPRALHCSAPPRAPPFPSSPQVSLDITMDLTIRVRNQDFYELDYDSLLVAIGYRGKRLGYVTSDGGHIKARGSSYVNATLQLDRVEILSDVVLLIEDLAKGAVTFDTESEITGKLGVVVFDLPLKTKVKCEVIVNTKNQTVSRQSCYPEVSEVSG
ncbi:UNVERIFIED_CONTAM: hypothetical protein Scaly_2945200 [Sesamum calycinum]|uniref:Late embryogenesis abundant protein LEA-2 subgroup domain-containing protein n=1 Tax=Sesamum calycinum TaxID=2727403 RepID=A0AAW2KUT0_9LAMI